MLHSIRLTPCYLWEYLFLITFFFIYVHLFSGMQKGHKERIAYFFTPNFQDETKLSLVLVHLNFSSRGNYMYYLLTTLKLYKTLIRPVVSYGAEEEQAVLIFERKIFRRRYGPKYENGGMEKSQESRTRRGERRRKYSKMDKRAKVKLVRSPRGN